MKKHTGIFLLCVLAFTVFSCTKNKTKELPPATQTGENTFGCKVNGEIWLPAGGGGLKPAFSEPAYYFSSHGFFGFHVSNYRDFTSTEIFYIEIDSMFQVGIYAFDSIVFNDTYRDENGNYFIPDPSLGSFFEITKIDTDNNIVSGLFEFHLISVDSTESVTVTDGRFDVGNVNVY